MTFWADDAATFLADFGSTVVYGGTTTKGLLDVGDVPDADGTGDVLVGVTRLRIKTGSIAPTVNATLTVDGTSYQVRDSRRLHDGTFTMLWLVPA